MEGGNGGTMKMFDFKRHVGVFDLLFLMGSTAHAVTLSVNCGAKEGLTTINAALHALKAIPISAPNTINVSGKCSEYVLIQNMDRLTLNAINGASITDASNGTHEVIDVDNS